MITSQEKLLHDIMPYLDINNLVKPNLSDINSANGVLYTSVLQILVQFPVYQDSINVCFKVPGLLMRTPHNDFGQESFDDYLGIAVASIVNKQSSIPRSILWYGVKHLFVFNNVNNPTFSSWLGRFVQVWVFMAVAAFRFLKYLLYPVLTFYIYTLIVNQDSSDGSGTQLQWLQVLAYDHLYGGNLTQMWALQIHLPLVFSNYYGINHPFAVYIGATYDKT